MSGFVADASATLPWCFEEEATPATEALLERLRLLSRRRSALYRPHVGGGLLSGSAPRVLSRRVRASLGCTRRSLLPPISPAPAQIPSARAILHRARWPACSPSGANYRPPAPNGIRRRSTTPAWYPCPAPWSRYRAR